MKIVKVCSSQLVFCDNQAVILDTIVGVCICLCIGDNSAKRAGMAKVATETGAICKAATINHIAQQMLSVLLDDHNSDWLKDK